jgi:energy-coupling factor transporter ATP-binding protein EcfA2
MTNEVSKNIGKRKSGVSDIPVLPVYFLSLAVERLLCFKDRQVLNLSNSSGSPAQWTVILGANGVGKSTLLRCLAGVETTMISSFQSIGEKESFVPLLSLPERSIGLQIWMKEVLGYSTAEITARFVVGDNFNSRKTPTSSPKPQKLETTVHLGISSSSRRELMGIVCYGYGANRKMGKTSLSESLSLENSASLFSEEFSLINAEEWLLQADYAFQTAALVKAKTRLKKQLNQIIEVLKRILPDVEDIRIAPADEDRERPTAEFLTPYGWVTLSGLGLGYQTTIAWMVDLAVRMFRRYSDSEDPLAEPAIVLVDEIDLHLHPKWQRTIMSFLTERFPNTQFIVTAHSPLVVQAAKDANIVLLRRDGDRVIIDNNPEIVDNWRVDQVLTSVFELPTTRSASLEPLLQRRQELLSKPKLTKKDEAELRKLNDEIGSLPTAETPEDIRAMDVIRRAAKLLENTQAGSAE